MSDSPQPKNTNPEGPQARGAGLDFGANLSGTTCLAWLEGAEIRWQTSRRGQPADRWLEGLIVELGIDVLGIDAPLSLPPRYQPQGAIREGLWAPEDYHYRPVDRLLGAMSPMFLGGLTARAIALADRCRLAGRTVIEVYPRARAQDLGLEATGYKDLEKGTAQRASTGSEVIAQWALAQDWSLMFGLGPLTLEQRPTTWHEVDAILALSTVTRFQLGQARPEGHPEHGVIWI